MYPLTKLAGVVVLAAMMAIAAPVAAQSIADSPEARQAAADRYLKTISVRTMLMQSAQQVVKRGILRGSQAEAYLKYIREFDTAEMERQVKGAMVRHFTAAEIDAMHKFFGSPVGRSILRKYPGYTATITPYLVRVMRQAITSARRQ